VLIRRIAVLAIVISGAVITAADGEGTGAGSSVYPCVDKHRARARAPTQGTVQAAVRSQCGRGTSALITPSAPVVSRLASASAQHVMFPLLTIRTPRTCGTSNHDEEC
jgi:hypothetical protein